MFRPSANVKFVAGASDPYAQRLSISSIVATFVTYLGSYSLPTTFLLALFGLVVLYATLLARRLEYYLIFAIIVTTIIPYTLLPNHITGYNAINWIPWMVAFMLVVLPRSLPSTREVAVWIREGRWQIQGATRRSSQETGAGSLDIPASPRTRSGTRSRLLSPRLSGAMGKIGVALLLTLTASVTLIQTQEGRVSELTYFVKQSNLNRNM